MQLEYNCSYTNVNNCSCFTPDFFMGISCNMKDCIRFPMKYGARMKAARIYAGLSQSALAEAANTSQANVSKLEDGNARGSEFTAQFAAACGVDPLWLATGVGDMISQYAASEKINRALTLLQEMPEYALDEAIKSVDSIAKLTKYKTKENQ